MIGNINYSKNSKLENAVNDPQAILTIFEQLGYDVIFKEDISNTDCSELLLEFESIKSEKAITPLTAFDRSLSVKIASERALEVGKALSVKWNIILAMLD